MCASQIRTLVLGEEPERQLVILLAYYQLLRSHKQADGFLDLALAREFGRHLAEA